jgi:predicted cupin superfamily sugar epimerase
MASTAADLIRELGLRPHPEGGHFTETFRDESHAVDGGRAASTAIYYLLARGEKARWHRVDSAEVWHFYSGAPLALHIVNAQGRKETFRLGPDVAGGDRPQIVVPAMAWQAAESLGDFTLAGCTVAPGFEYAHFELAPPDWEPG